MPIMTYKVVLDDDNSITRYIEVDTHNTFQDFHRTILESMEFDDKHEGIFYTSNKNWRKIRGISTKVKKNLASAELLSAKKTPISALVASPDQRFLYEYLSKGKTWIFTLEMIKIEQEGTTNTRYPYVSESEGLAPSQYNPNIMKTSSNVKAVEKVLQTSEVESDKDQVTDNNG